MRPRDDRLAVALASWKSDGWNRYAVRVVGSTYNVSVNGAFSFLEYEIALSRGNPKNIDYDDRGDPYVVAGRIGTASDTNLVRRQRRDTALVW